MGLWVVRAAALASALTLASLMLLGLDFASFLLFGVVLPGPYVLVLLLLAREGDDRTYAALTLAMGAGLFVGVTSVFILLQPMIASPLVRALFVLALLQALLVVVAWRLRPGYAAAYGRPGSRLFAWEALVVGGAVLGVLAILLIPTGGHSPVGRNESLAIGDIRTVIAAEVAYQAANGGFYDSLQCLGAPRGCLPAYPVTSPAFLDARLASAKVDSGYSRTFHLGPPAPPDVVASGKISPSSVTSFAYVAVPVKPGQTGVRAFCGDSRGRICYTADGTPPVEDGACRKSCSLLE